eukprot:933943-Rhodomonas_salina.1
MLPSSGIQGSDGAPEDLVADLSSLFHILEFKEPPRASVSLSSLDEGRLTIRSWVAVQPPAVASDLKSLTTCTGIAAGKGPRIKSRWSTTGSPDLKAVGPLADRLR